MNIVVEVCIKMLMEEQNNRENDTCSRVKAKNAASNL